MEHLVDNDPSIVFLQETWLKENRSNVTAMVKEYDYILLHNIRKNRKKESGGGVGIMLKRDIKYKRLKHKQFSSFEHIIVKVMLGNNKSVLLISIYRVLFTPVTVFLEEMVTLLEYLTAMKEDVVLAGDINIHMETNELYANKFKDILHTFDITQHIDFPTHIQGHTLDVITTFGEEPPIFNIAGKETDISHHQLITFNLDIVPEKKAEKQITCRNLKGVDMQMFMNEVKERLQVTESSFEDNIRKYNTVTKEIVDDQAPLRTITIKTVKTAPWFDGEYKQLRKERRKAERKFRKTRSLEDKKEYINLTKQTTELAHKKKCKHYGDKLEENNLLLFSSLKTLLDNEHEEVLPEAESDEELANRFLKYFSDKIAKIRSTFPEERKQTPKMPLPGGKLSEFEPATEDEIRGIVKEYGIKCSPEDPIPAALLKMSDMDLFIPIWTQLVNLSLREGSMQCLKNGILLPLIKQLDEIMDKENDKNYRPVTNLQFVGKLIERVVNKRLNEHMRKYDLESDFEHGYKEGHSTETLLLKAVDDLLISCDNGLPSIVMLLDLSAAFDTVDQLKLVQILEEEIGIEGTALKWFVSFLTGRTQRVKVRGAYSEVGDLLYGEAQGSVLGPPLFNIYIRSLKKQVEPSGFSIYGFADDHQLIKTFLPVLQIQALDGDINKCFELITDWMDSFFLRLNATKTKILVIGPSSVRNTVVVQGTFIGKSCIRFVDSAKNLGVILDNELTFKEHVEKVVKQCFGIIRKLSKIRAFLTYEQLRTAVSAFIFSRLDYCNSLFFGISEELLNKMQYVQNCAARLVKGKNKSFRGSTLEFIRGCNWLRVRERIIFKISLLVHKCLYGVAPKCLKELFVYAGSKRTMKLRHETYNSSYGSRCFRRVAPKIWNLLPLTIRCEKDVTMFKKGLKTFLFDGYDDFARKLKEV